MEMAVGWVMSIYYMSLKKKERENKHFKQQNGKCLVLHLFADSKIKNVNKTEYQESSANVC